MYRPYHGHQVDEYYEGIQPHIRWDCMGTSPFQSTQFSISNGEDHYGGLPKLQEWMNVAEKTNRMP